MLKNYHRNYISFKNKIGIYQKFKTKTYEQIKNKNTVVQFSFIWFKILSLISSLPISESLSIIY